MTPGGPPAAPRAQAPSTQAPPRAAGALPAPPRDDDDPDAWRHGLAHAHVPHASEHAPASPPPIAAATTPASPPTDDPTLPPAFAWKRALASLGPLSRAIVEDHAAFLSYEGGVLRLAARGDRQLAQVQEHVRHADFTAWLPGFRNVQVIIDAVGRTGREARNAAEAQALAAARTAADASKVLARLVTAFGGVVEEVEPLVVAPFHEPEEEMNTDV